TFTIFFTSTAFALTGLVQSLGSFYIPSIMSLVSNLLVLGYLFLFFERWGVHGLAVAFVLGSVMQVVIFWIPLRKHKFKYRPKLSLKDEGIKRILRLTPAVMVSSWLIPIIMLVNGAIAGRQNSAYLPQLILANTVFMVITGMFILSVTNVIFPKLSREAAKDSGGEYAKTLSSSISAIIFILIPMSVGIFVLRVPLVRLAFERGEFTAENTATVAYALGILAVGAVGYGLVSLLSRSLYAKQDAKTPVIATLIAIVANIIIAFVFVDTLGIGGVALAVTASITLAGVIMYGVVAKRFGILNKSAAINFAKMAVSAAIMFGAVWLTLRFVEGIHDILKLAIVALVGVIIYTTSAIILKVDEAKMAKAAIMARLRGRVS
ncbi:MAG: polysaccharide biosynthesis C-terminal domain-containing protein, partial [Defluviitaleaceae bacterium]|nr:polysaccharide biosynthesis C-terminal domain-containing protein [Defluviitaleaceae bacterium]